MTYDNIQDIIAKHQQANLLNYIKRHNLIEEEIIDIFNGNIDEYVLKYNNCSPIQLIFALYYQFEVINYEVMKIYYLYCIENNNSTAMNNLAYYYQFTEKDFEKSVLYYKMAISLNNSTSMNNLAYYYEKNLNNLDKAIYYYKLSINNGCKDAIINLACLYYKNNELTLAKEYIELYIKKYNNTQLTLILDKIIYFESKK
jgi:TPR repeat protein